ncbi:hypothetical protein BDZ97DRAFT_1759485 [Flammula alnicola]|nr:hypothetical protein BDZ97DRAFT_1759485 [Flammula alnicola]
MFCTVAADFWDWLRSVPVVPLAPGVDSLEFAIVLYGWLVAGNDCSSEVSLFYLLSRRRLTTETNLAQLKSVGIKEVVVVPDQGAVRTMPWSSGSKSLFYVLLRDSILFPFIALVICLTNVVGYKYFSFSASRINNTIAEFGTQVVGGRLILNLREVYYRPFEDEFPQECRMPLIPIAFLHGTEEDTDDRLLDYLKDEDITAGIPQESDTYNRYLVDLILTSVTFPSIARYTEAVLIIQSSPDTFQNGLVVASSQINTLTNPNAGQMMGSLQAWIDDLVTWTMCTEGLLLISNVVMLADSPTLCLPLANLLPSLQRSTVGIMVIRINVMYRGSFGIKAVQVALFVVEVALRAIYIDMAQIISDPVRHVDNDNLTEVVHRYYVVNPPEDSAQPAVYPLRVVPLLDQPEAMWVRVWARSTRAFA